MRVFVAGATGAIGRPLVGALLEAGHAVTAMTRSSDAARGLRARGADAVICDVFQSERLLAAVRASRADAVVHELTAIPAVMHPRRFAREFAATTRLRIEGTRNLLRAARAAGARRFVVQSVAFAYRPEGDLVKDEDAALWDDAPSWAAPFRAIAEMERMLAASDGIRAMVLRYGLFYGPGTAFARDGQIGHMVARRQYPITGSGEGMTSFVHVEDAAAATVASLALGRSTTLNVVDDEPAPLREWLPAYAEALGAPKPLHVPAVAAKLAGPYAEYLATEQRGASNARARRELGWVPRYPSWRLGFSASLA